ncbi:Ubiquitin-conjugating enzyme [Ceraceosorus bombacis]|uniref:Ubiquitin-conjugating enzyme n=1 Tax=Ceraceosorus bombacis TaxID=401625 RepID=A0A0P1BM05_9BASI|nr:Ubiquitin-conjugating enzyme [Ceraceosorus bombacis]
MPSQNGAIPNIFVGDVVRTTSEGAYPPPKQVAEEEGYVLRVWSEEEDLLPDDFQGGEPSVNRKLEKGEIGMVIWPSHARKIAPASSVTLIDRTFGIGDVVQARASTSRAGAAPRTGMVTATRKKLRLRHITTGQEAHDVPAEHVRGVLGILPGDHVAYGDWVGVVESTFEDAMVATPSGLRRICDVGGLLTVGEMEELHGPSGGSGLPPMIRRALGFESPSETDHSRRPVMRQAIVKGPPNRERVHTVLSVKQPIIAVDWLALNQKMSPEQSAASKRPKRFWYSREEDELIVLSQAFEHDYPVGDKVEFVSPTIAAQHDMQMHQMHGIDVTGFHVLSRSTQVDVLWQDATTSTEHSTALEPYTILDEHDVWPGEFASYQPGHEAIAQVGVVQSVDPFERTARLRLYKAQGEVLSVPLFDIRPRSSEQADLRLGDTVLIADHCTGTPPPMVPTLGAPGDDANNAQLHEQMSMMGMQVCASRRWDADSAKLRQPSESVDWYGVVDAIGSDGSVVVKLPAGRKVVEPYEHLSLLDDGFDHGGPHAPWDSDQDDDDEMTDASLTSDEIPWVGEDGEEVDESAFDDWMDVEEEAKQDIDGATSSGAVRRATTASLTNGTADKVDTPPTGGAVGGSSGTTPIERFAILESAPQDHAFLKDEPRGMSRFFAARLQKEFKALQSSLPDSILVRGYEDRQDLLRVLIIGSKGTPFEDAPILIDFSLKGDYPHSPPVAHYHSWTAGDRVSPNLYHDGKVCLSLLGTWAGQESSESWTPSRSTLLQVFVSIQALVLVSRPYFTEPDLEQTSGTEAGEANSRLYNERVYIATRSFVKRVLDKPILGLEDELKELYLGSDAKLLQSIIKRAEELLEGLEMQAVRPELAVAPVEEPVVHRLSRGGAIVLHRAVEGLKLVLRSKASAAA